MIFSLSMKCSNGMQPLMNYLQPGQGYFIANSKDVFLTSVEFEILPLIREYLQEQLLISAKEEFNNYFLSRIQKPIFE